MFWHFGHWIVDIFSGCYNYLPAAKRKIRILMKIKISFTLSFNWLIAYLVINVTYEVIISCSKLSPLWLRDLITRSAKFIFLYHMIKMRMKKSFSFLEGLKQVWSLIFLITLVINENDGKWCLPSFPYCVLRLVFTYSLVFNFSSVWKIWFFIYVTRKKQKGCSVLKWLIKSLT